MNDRYKRPSGRNPKIYGVFDEDESSNQVSYYEQDLRETADWLARKRKPERIEYTPQRSDSDIPMIAVYIMLFGYSATGIIFTGFIMYRRGFGEGILALMVSIIAVGLSIVIQYIHYKIYWWIAALSSILALLYAIVAVGSALTLGAVFFGF